MEARIGKLVYSMMVSLDGFIETPERSLDWVRIDEELHTFVNDQVRREAAFLYGRRLYEVMAAYWPTADEDPNAPAFEVDFARIWKRKPKVVFSKTLPSVAWNSRLVREGAVDEVSRLKQSAEADLEIGGPNLASTMIQHDLVDEFGLFLQPVVLGAGTPFFPPLGTRIDLRLLESRTFRSGVTYVRYERSAR